VYSKPYFHGDINKDEAFNRLKNKDVGTFLLRFSARSNNFVISLVIDRNHQKFITHISMNHGEVIVFVKLF
jgi:hypothetical protein